MDSWSIKPQNVYKHRKDTLLETYRKGIKKHNCQNDDVNKWLQIILPNKRFMFTLYIQRFGIHVH